MAFSSIYIVVPFLAGAEGVLHPGAPRLSKARAVAVATADSLAQIYAGVIVLRDRSDIAAGIFLEPRPILVIGNVPADLLESLDDRAVAAADDARRQHVEERPAGAKPALFS